MRHHIREIIIYCVFVLLFTYASIWTAQDQGFFHMGNVIKGRLTQLEFGNNAQTFRTIHTISDWYAWMEGPFVNTMYSPHSFDGVTPRNLSGTFYGHDVLIGGGARECYTMYCSQPRQQLTQLHMTQRLHTRIMRSCSCEPAACFPAPM